MSKRFLLVLLLLASIMQSGYLAANCDECPEQCCELACPKKICPCDCKAVGHTFFSIAPVFGQASPEARTLFRHDRLHARQDGMNGAVQIVPFGGRSGRPEELAAFFLPVCKNVLIVAEDPNDPDVDVLARYFNILRRNFKSKISFSPRHSFAGIGFQYRQGFAQRDDGRLFWFDITLPVMHVKNSLNFCEEIINAGDPRENCEQNPGFVIKRSCPIDCEAIDDSDDVRTTVDTMTDAFKQDSWHCGRIDCRCEGDGKTGLASFDFRVGYETVAHEACHLETYVGFSAPTGNKVRGFKIFEPIVGNNHHFAIMAGNNLGLELWANEEGDKNLWMEFSLHGMYLLRNCQKRLVDLKCKPWSRFMRVYRNQAQAQLAFNTNDECLHTPGVNVFCLDVRVSPAFQRTYNMAFVFNSHNFEAEVGYNFFARSPECVELKCPWEEGPALIAYQGFKDLCEDPIPPFEGLPGGTDSVQTIGDDFDGDNARALADYNFNLIHQCDLDLESASHPATLTHTIYASLGYRWDENDLPPFVGIGGSYEFSRDNTGLDRWMLWGKFGLSF